jgi:hypothetical protein
MTSADTPTNAIEIPLDTLGTLRITQRRELTSGSVEGRIEIFDRDGTLDRSVMVVASPRTWPALMVGSQRLRVTAATECAICRLLLHPESLPEVLAEATDPGTPAPPRPADAPGVDGVLLRAVVYAHRVGLREGYARAVREGLVGAAPPTAVPASLAPFRLRTREVRYGRV